MLERFSTCVRDAATERTLTAHTNIAASQDVTIYYQELISQGGIPLVYANHQSHADGIALAVIAEYLRDLAFRATGDFSINGFVVPFAASMASGDQSEELKESYELLKGASERKGLVGFTTTREKDEKLYGMRKSMMELRPLIKRLHEGYGMMLLPEGTVQGGRHNEGADIEEIYGIQRVENDSLTEYFELMKEIFNRQGNGRRPFFMPVGLNGGFRIMQSTEGDPPRPKLTPKGKLSLILGGLTGLSLIKIQANLLMPYDEEEITGDLNDYAMRKVASGVPPQARGIYKEELGLEVAA